MDPTKPTFDADLLLDPERRDLEPRVGQVGHVRMFSELKSIDHDARTIDFVCSTGTIDRYGEIVEPEAFRGSLDAFMLNPAFPAGHWYEFTGGQTPTVGHWKSMQVMSSKLAGKAWFKPRGLGQECWLDYTEGNLTSVSVAFLTRKWEMRETNIGGEKRRVRVFTEVDLLECSAVLIPANPQARLRAAAYAQARQCPDLTNLQTLIERFEKLLDVDRDDSTDQLHLTDDAEDWFGRDGYDDDGYFGSIPGEGEPGLRLASQGDDADLKAALRDTLAARSQG